MFGKYLLARYISNIYNVFGYKNKLIQAGIIKQE
jgi:hypothetical protein